MNRVLWPARLPARCCLGAALTCFIASSAIAFPEYRVTAIPLIGDRAPRNAAGINNHGNVIGNSHLSGSLSRGFLDAQDVILPGISGSITHDINDAGIVVGYSSSTGGPVHAFMFSESAGITDLSPVLGNPSVAYGINNLGHIVGSASVQNGFHAFLLINGSLTLFEETSPAIRINDAGLIAGHGWIYEAGIFNPLLFENGSYSNPYGMNELGQVVGQADNDSGFYRAFLYEGGTMTDLGTLGGEFARGMGINSEGTIVGYSTLSSDEPRAFIRRDGMLTDLNSLIDPTSGWDLQVAADINDSGQIVGSGLLAGEFRAFLLQPVPEPGSFLLAAMSVAGLTVFVRRRRVSFCRCSLAGGGHALNVLERV